MLGAELYLGKSAILFADSTKGSYDTTMEVPDLVWGGTTTNYYYADTSGVNYGLQFTLGDRNSFALTPYFMAVSQTITPETGPEVSVDSRVIGLDIVFNKVSLTALYQSSDDADLTMLSLCIEF